MLRPDPARFLAVVLLLLSPGRQGPWAQGRPPVEGGLTTSLGQPRVWTGTVGASSAALGGPGRDREVAHLRLGAFRDIGNPVAGILGWQVEAYGGTRGGDLDGGLRTSLVMLFAGLGVGADFNALDHQTRVVLSAMYVARRGGIFGMGARARFDYLPARDHSVTAGLEMPIFRRTPAGQTRPRWDHVRLSVAPARPVQSALPDGRRPGLEATLVVLRAEAERIRSLGVPFVGRDAPPRVPRAGGELPGQLRDLKAAVAAVGETGTSGPARGVAIERATRRYHAAMDRAFSIALAGRSFAEGETTPEGRRAAEEARTILLSEVLLPYDRLLGQVKDPDTVLGFGHRAEGLFLRWIHMGAAASGEAAVAALSVFSALVDAIEASRAATAAEWQDSRFVWLPLQYALLPEDSDTQAELDAIAVRALEEPFTEGNRVSYVINEQFQYQLHRTIHAAEEYHVLWTHDFRGNDDVGNPDEMAFRQVVRSYLSAMTKRVRAYDSTGTLPLFMILHDEWYYELRNGRLFLNLLEDPTRFRLRLPSAFKAWEDTIAASQRELREAIAGSSLLQAQRVQYGEAWLQNLIKVHVSVTNPADLSFLSWKVVPFLPLPDNMNRDHRKAVFYDVTEEDPYRGEALYTGAGVGEHYSSLTWEDRSLLVRGPSNLGLKAAARRLLLGHGIPSDQIPHALRVRARAPDYDERVQRAVAGDEWPLRALAVHNGVGFDSKQVNVAKAVLYSLMPPGSVVMVPDSFWNSEFWGSALLGAALRGVRVLLIAPSYASNSVSVFGTQLLSRELLLRLLSARDALTPEIAAAGGMLKLGIYDSKTLLNDIPGKVSAVRAVFAETPWLRELFEFPPEVYADLATFEDEIKGLRMPPCTVPEFECDGRTKLHLKANFFASREAWRIMTRPEWSEMMRAFVMQRIAQVQVRRQVLSEFGANPYALIDIGGGYVQDWFARLDPAVRERVIFYTVMGSQNQNTRSMVIDGEVAIVVANWPSVAPYLDLISLVGQSRWVESTAEIDALLPPMGRLLTALTHWFLISF